MVPYVHSVQTTYLQSPRLRRGLRRYYSAIVSKIIWGDSLQVLHRLIKYSHGLVVVPCNTYKNPGSCLEVLCHQGRSLIFHKFSWAHNTTANGTPPPQEPLHKHPRTFILRVRVKGLVAFETWGERHPLLFPSTCVPLRTFFRSVDFASLIKLEEYWWVCT